MLVKPPWFVMYLEGVIGTGRGRTGSQGCFSAFTAPWEPHPSLGGRGGSPIPSHPTEPLAPSRIPAPQELLKKQKPWWKNQVCELSSWMESREVWSLPENSTRSLTALQMPGRRPRGRIVPGFRAAGFLGSASTGTWPWCLPGCGGTGKREPWVGRDGPGGSFRQQSSD